MNNTLLADGTVLYYALKVNGRIITPPLLNPALLEEYRRNLPPDQKALAEVVSVTPEGREMLLG